MLNHRGNGKLDLSIVKECQENERGNTRTSDRMRERLRDFTRERNREREMDREIEKRARVVQCSLCSGRIHAAMASHRGYRPSLVLLVYPLWVSISSIGP